MWPTVDQLYSYEKLSIIHLGEGGHQDLILDSTQMMKSTVLKSPALTCTQCVINGVNTVHEEEKCLNLAK